MERYPAPIRSHPEKQISFHSLEIDWKSIRLNPTQSEDSNPNQIFNLYQTVAYNRNRFDFRLNCINFNRYESVENQSVSIQDLQSEWIRSKYSIHTKQSLPIGIISSLDWVVSNGFQFRSIQIRWKSICFNP